ncbi:uncharacterized protein LOC141905706 [Tubulanus polymorphus]|uniref:uncharacterized protein LOC141905706 n=1 Tax=Tubulanus polymorphus TaxID=672921 RepID=UPI003DA4B4D2
MHLLDFDWAREFQCVQCGKHPQVIVCDGVDLGFRKDFLKSIQLMNFHNAGTRISGTHHKDRVFVPDNKARKLLSQYAWGPKVSSKTHVKPRSPLPLTPEEKQDLILRISKYEHLNPLKNKVSASNSLNCKSSETKFLQAISANGPACAFLQTNDLDRVIDILDHALSEITETFDSKNSEIYNQLLIDAPILIEFISQSLSDGNLHNDYIDLIRELLKKIRTCFKCNKDHIYTPAPYENLFKSLSFFPSLPKHHSDAAYVMDDKKDNDMCRDDACNKMSKRHRVLTPGIFTVFCPHGICYGFQAMESHESPRFPFSIFKTRFPRPPSMIVYDNACKLHQYALNREPEFFKNTIFCVDRMHWVNHTGCCAGYKLDTYCSNVDLSNINSQVNEQFGTYSPEKSTCLHEARKLCLACSIISGP